MAQTVRDVPFAGSAVLFLIWSAPRKSWRATELELGPKLPVGGE
jgi:hypothetical protein